jgi:hypothetical protein
VSVNPAGSSAASAALETFVSWIWAEMTKMTALRSSQAATAVSR